MKIVEQRVELLSSTDYIMPLIEIAGRECYDSKEKICEGSTEQFITGLINNKHESPLEFGDITVRLITSRDVLAEITRHRLASFCVRSQRYVAENKHGEIEFIRPLFYKESKTGYDDELIPEDMASEDWFEAMSAIEVVYNHMLQSGMKKQDARKVLPNSTATSIIMKANIREWRHILKLRTSKAAYPEMRQLMIMVLRLFQEKLPVLFQDIIPYEGEVK